MAPETCGPSDFVATYPAVPASVAAIRRALAQFARAAGAPRGTVDAIVLAASEAATNVVLHAYRDKAESGEIELFVTRSAVELAVIVRDRGSGLTLRTDSPGLGLGLAIIARATDRLDILESPTGGVEVRMYFAVATTGR